MVDGFVAEEAIRGRARQVAADLIVMTTHGRGPVSRAFLGSVADQLVRHCLVPVLLVRPHEVLPDLHHEPAVTRVLIPLDRSPASEQILGPAIHLGSALRASFTFLHVVHPPDEGPAPKTRHDRAAGLKRSCQEQSAEESLAYLEQLARWFRTPSIDIRTHVVVGGERCFCHPGRVRAQSCGLIALATHGRGGFKRLVLGSVADKVVRGASCPVLVYREAERLSGSFAETGRDATVVLCK